MSVKEAFEAGVAGQQYETETTATDISRSANTGYESHAQRVEAQLDKVRSATAAILKIDDEASTEIAELADAAIDAMAAALDKTDDVRRDVGTAQADVAKKFTVDLPGIDPGTVRQLRDQATKAVVVDVTAKAKAALDEAARKAGEACARVEMFLDLEDDVSPELDAALDGKVTPGDLASEQSAVSELTPISMARIRKMYGLMTAAEKDQKRLLRFERAALKVAAARKNMSTEQLIAYTAGLGRDLAPKEKEHADGLADDIAKRRASRAPRSVRIAKDILLKTMHEAFRLLCMSDRVHFDATGASSSSVLAEQQAPWTPLTGWQARYGLAK